MFEIILSFFGGSILSYLFVFDVGAIAQKIIDNEKINKLEKQIKDLTKIERKLDSIHKDIASIRNNYQPTHNIHF
jgi:hypothetical protein